MAITLYENFRAVFYSPFYAAQALGAYAAEGVEVNMTTSEGTEDAVSKLIAGEVDVSWGGPLRVIKAHDQDPDSPLVAFCEVVCKDPFYLVGREARPGFDFTGLEKLRFGTVSEVPTPWLCLQQDLRDAGVDPDALPRVTDRTMPANADALRAGEADVVQLFEPFAEQLVREKAGHIWYAAAMRGLCAYTSFYTTRAAIAERPDPLRRMTRAMFRTLKWIHANPPGAFADLIADYFPDLSRAELAGALGRYLELGLWSDSTILTRPGFERLRAGMISGGFVSREVPYEECVYTTFAEEVAREDPPVAG